MLKPHRVFSNPLFVFGYESIILRDLFPIVVPFCHFSIGLQSGDIPLCGLQVHVGVFWSGSWGSLRGNSNSKYRSDGDDGEDSSYVFHNSFP